jgi:phosphate-selective porin O/P
MDGWQRVPLRVFVAVWALVVVLAPAPAAAQSSDGPRLTFTGRVHAQWNSTSAAGQVGSEFRLRRARVTAVLKVNDLVSGRIQPEFAGESASLKDAYLKLSFSKSFNVTMGQFKRAFDFFELESSTRNLVIERAGGIRGAGSCAGVGGICAYSRFTEKLRYADRDIGVMVDGRLGDSPLSYRLSVTNGEGANRPDVNTAKSYAARVVYSVMSDLKVAANVSVHDYVNDVDPTRDYSSAWGVDVDWGSYSPGLHLQGSFVSGQNWKDLGLDGTPSSFATTQGVLSYRFAIVGHPNVSGIEPVLRVSWADPDTDVASDRDLLLTTGVMLHFMGRNRVAANLDMWDPAQGDNEWSLKVQTYLHF